jgi:hypothetical protein
LIWAKSEQIFALGVFDELREALSNDSVLRFEVSRIEAIGLSMRFGVAIVKCFAARCV